MSTKHCWDADAVLEHHAGTVRRNDFRLAGSQRAFRTIRVTRLRSADKRAGSFDDTEISAADGISCAREAERNRLDGTSSGGLASTRREAVSAIEQTTGIPECTSVLALNDLRPSPASTFGLVTPYLDDVQDRLSGTMPHRDRVRCRTALGQARQLSFPSIRGEIRSMVATWPVPSRRPYEFSARTCAEPLCR